MKTSLKEFRKLNYTEQADLIFEHMTQDDKDCAVLSWIIEGLDDEVEMYNQFIKKS